MLRVLPSGTQGYYTTKEGLWKKMITVTTPANMTEQKLFPTALRVCQTCRYCTPKQSEGPIGLFCENPNILGYYTKADVTPLKSPTSIFWAVLKHCGDERKYWEGA